MERYIAIGGLSGMIGMILLLVSAVPALILYLEEEFVLVVRKAVRFQATLAIGGFVLCAVALIPLVMDPSTVLHEALVGTQFKLGARFILLTAFAIAPLTVFAWQSRRALRRGK